MRLIFSALIFGALFVLGLPLATAAQSSQTLDSATALAPPPAAAEPNYRIKQGDKMSVKFLYHPELNETALAVRPDGFVSLQMIDDVKAEGLTVAELKKRLEKAYEEILLRPVITVALLEFVAPRVYIGGQIGKPGRYDLREARTLIQAVFLAGGFTRDANRKMVIHARPDERNNWRYQSANVLKILGRKGEEKDIELRDGDYIYVPDSKISQINKAVEGFRSLLPRFF